MNRKRIFQVVGVPRSGTTLLAAALDNHCNIICLIEPYLSWLTRGYFEIDKLSGINTNRTIYTKPPHYYISQLCKHSTFKLIGFKETFRGDHHPTFPTKQFITDNVQENCVDATIALVRDPRDIWASVINRSGYLKHKTPIEEIIPDWIFFSRWILDNMVFFVRYEDLVSKPESTLRSIGKYLGFDFASGMLVTKKKKGGGDKRAQNTGTIGPYSVGRFRDDLSIEIIKYIQHHCGKLMKKLGYN